jgi:hypothetical protein
MCNWLRSVVHISTDVFRLHGKQWGPLRGGGGGGGTDLVGISNWRGWGLDFVCWEKWE